MNRKANGETAPRSAVRTMPLPRSSPTEVGEAAQALQQAAQPLLDWLDETRASQIALLDACSLAMQSAVDAAAIISKPSGLLQAQGELLGAALAQASRFQREMLSDWLTRLSAPAQREAWAPPELSAAFEQTRTSFEEALRSWAALWDMPAAQSQSSGSQARAAA